MPSGAGFIVARMLEWTDQPDGSRVRVVNGIRIVDRTTRPVDTGIEYLVTWQDADGRVVVEGLDETCHPVMRTTL
jgi:hypothetical protein